MILPSQNHGGHLLTTLSAAEMSPNLVPVQCGSTGGGSLALTHDRVQSVEFATDGFQSGEIERKLKLNFRPEDIKHGKYI